MPHRFFVGILTVTILVFATGAAKADEGEELLAGHPRESYAEVKNIDAMESALRKSLGEQKRYSFSRSWWKWDRLRCRYVDGGRKDENAAKILRAVFRGLMLDWHRKLEAKGEGDVLYIFYTTVKGDKNERHLGISNRTLLRDLHGGGYHGGWGGASRMRIYEELANQNMLTGEEKARFKKIVYQSLDAKFIDFNKGAQSANNHSFGNAGGVAMALKLFPDAPQAEAARAWIDRIWKHLADFGDWTEWTYYPYGPIFLHGVLDVAEATGRIESDRELINALGRRCLGFVHGGGVRGNPNSGAPVRSDLSSIYADPWNVGYYKVETSSRDGQFWYRMAQHYKNPEYLWAAEQVALGGRSPSGKVPAEYASAYHRRFAWFVQREISPRAPASSATVGLLSARKQKIPERLYLDNGRASGSPRAAYFLYDKKDEHLDNISGFLYEYSVGGAKFLNSSGKYNSIYRGDTLKSMGSGEENLDLLMVVHRRHAFPLHPDHQGDERDLVRRGFLKHDHEFVKAEANKAGDSFGQFAFDNYYGKGSRWIRRTVLTREGYLIVADQYTAGPSLGGDYLVGPVWHLAPDEKTTSRRQGHHWFDAPALDYAWWQKDKKRVVLYFHNDEALKYGALEPLNLQDAHPNVATFAYGPLKAAQPQQQFLSLLIPHSQARSAEKVVAKLKTRQTNTGGFVAAIEETTVTIQRDGSWTVSRGR